MLYPTEFSILQNYTSPLHVAQGINEASSWSMAEYRESILEDLSQIASSIDLDSEIPRGRGVGPNLRSVMTSSRQPDGHVQHYLSFEQVLFPLHYRDGRVELGPPESALSTSELPLDRAVVQSKPYARAALSQINGLVPVVIEKQVRLVETLPESLKEYAPSNWSLEVRDRAILDRQKSSLKISAGEVALGLKQYSVEGVIFEGSCKINGEEVPISLLYGRTGAVQVLQDTMDSPRISATLEAIRPVNEQINSIGKAGLRIVAADVIANMKDTSHPFNLLVERIRTEGEIVRARQASASRGTDTSISSSSGRIR